MALLKKRPDEIPSDAIILSEDQALRYKRTILDNWDVNSDIAGYKYALPILGVGSATIGAYFNSHYRTKFKLRNYGRVASYLPICVVPALLSMLLHREAVQRNLIIPRSGQCAVCMEMRASAIQALVGCVFPLILAPASSASLVHRFATYNMPYITVEPKKAFATILQVSKPLKNVAFGIFLGQALLASVVTHFEAKSIMKVEEKLMIMERESEQS